MMKSYVSEVTGSVKIQMHPELNGLCHEAV